MGSSTAAVAGTASAEIVGIASTEIAGIASVEIAGIASAEIAGIASEEIAGTASAGDTVVEEIAGRMERLGGATEVPSSSKTLKALWYLVRKEFNK